MDHIYPRYQRLFFLAALLTACSLRPAKAQQIENDVHFIFAGTQSYLVDLKAITAKPLPITWTDGYFYRLSGDGKRLAVVGKDGVTLHVISNGSIQQTLKVTDAPSKGGIWSKDNKTLSYVQETGTGEGVTIKIYTWNAETGETRRLL